MRMLLNYGAIPIFILQGDIPSLFTSMFMHAGVAHIVGNMVFLFVFGDNIEDRFGHIKYLLIYLMWGVVAAYIHSIYVIEALGVESGLIPAVGASGAISGVFRCLSSYVSKSQNFHSNNSLLHNNYSYTCISIHSSLVYFTDYFWPS